MIKGNTYKISRSERYFNLEGKNDYLLYSNKLSKIKIEDNYIIKNFRRNKKVKKIISVILVLIMMLSVVACSSSKEATNLTKDETNLTKDDKTSDTSANSSETNTDENYKVGFALQTLEVAVWQRMVNGMEEAAKDLGIEFKTFVADSDVSQQIANIENMISMEYDAIIVHVFDTEAFSDVVQEALDKGIVICAYDDTIVDPASGEALDYQFSFVCDNYEMGYRIGTMAAEWTLQQFSDENAKLEMGCLWHPEYKLQWDRVEGIKDALAEKDPRIEIVEELEGLLVEDGVKAAEAWNQTYPNLVGVVATNDTCLQGYAEAWGSAGKDIKDENFGMFGCDGVGDAIDMVSRGEIIRGDVGLDVYTGGYDTVEACVHALNEGSSEDIIMPMIDVTVENAQEWISDPKLYGE